MLTATALTTLIDALATDIAKRHNALNTLTLYSIAQDFGAALGPFLSYLILSKVDGQFYVYFGSSALLLALGVSWFAVYNKTQRPTHQDVNTS